MLRGLKKLPKATLHFTVCPSYECLSYFCFGQGSLAVPLRHFSKLLNHPLALCLHSIFLLPLFIIYSAYCQVQLSPVQHRNQAPHLLAPHQPKGLHPVARHPNRTKIWRHRSYSLMNRYVLLPGPMGGSMTSVSGGGNSGREG